MKFINWEQKGNFKQSTDLLCLDINHCCPHWLKEQIMLINKFKATKCACNFVFNFTIIVSLSIKKTITKWVLVSNRLF